MQQININELKVHPRNNEFFDDMTGEKWKEFLESIKTRGVIEPIVITPNKIIVSGHQRVRACKELGIKAIMCDIHTYSNEDEILQDLLETNIHQRGDVGGSAKKVGSRIKELERIYGIHNGNQLSNNCKPEIKQTDSTEKFGKRNPDVNRAIENLIVQNCTVKNMFIKTSYTSSRSRDENEYLMDRDGFSLLVMGFTGKKALEWKLKYIDAFNKMEETLKSLQYLNEAKLFRNGIDFFYKFTDRNGIHIEVAMKNPFLDEYFYVECVITDGFSIEDIGKKLKATIVDRVECKIAE